MRLFARLALISLLIFLLPANLAAAGNVDLAAPAPGDLSCDTAFALPGLDSIYGDSSTYFHYQGNGGGVFALVSAPDASVFAGGAFTLASGQPARNVACWDGSQWQPLLGGLDDKVNALALDDAGNLYLAGLFQSASGLPVDGFAEWDGTGWSKPYGTQLTCTANCGFTALAWDSHNYQMYLGGTFNVGETWQQVGVWNPFSGYQGIPGEPFDVIIALALDGDGNLNAGAQKTFYSAGGLEMWDGHTWSTPANITPQAISTPKFISRTDGQGRVIVARAFTSACGTTMFYITRLDNGGGVAYGSGLSGWVPDLAFDPQGRLVASGYFKGAGSRRVEGLARWTLEPLLTCPNRDALPDPTIV